MIRGVQRGQKDSNWNFTHETFI